MALSKITNGGVAASGLPDGSVLQVVSTDLESTTQLTSSGAFSELSTSLRLAITPISSSSKLVLECFAPFVSPNSNSLAYAYFYDVTNTAAVNLPTASGSRRAVTWAKRTTAFDINDMDTLNMMTVVSNTNTTARTYTIYHSTEGSQVHQFLNTTLSTSAGTNTHITFTITEIG